MVRVAITPHTPVHVNVRDQCRSIRRIRPDLFGSSALLLGWSIREILIRCGTSRRLRFWSGFHRDHAVDPDLLGPAPLLLYRDL